MHYVALTVSALILISIATSTYVAAQESHDDGCLPMSDLTAIVFKQTMTQNRRRSSNVPSLQCIGNCPADAPGLIQAHCTKQGSDDYGRPTWRCSPQFANEGGETKRVLYGLGNIQVECEGCSKKGDSNVVRGSCSLKYSITTGGNRKAGMRRREHYGSSSHDAIGAVVWLIFGVTTVAATIAICRGCLAKPYQTSAKSEYTTDGNGNVYGAPMYAGGGGGAVHHHYGGSGGGGFGTGMLTGFVLGDMMSRSHYAPGYGYGYEGAVAEYGGGFGFGGNDGAFDSAGWGGTDSI